MTKRRSVLAILLVCHSLLLAYNGWWMSPTLDEPAHVVAGISHWQRGDFSLYRVNPPLVRLVATVPVLLVGQDYELPERLNGVTDRMEFHLGEAFMEHNGRRSLWLVALGRWACIPFSLLAAVTCYWWARDLFGQRAGVAAAALWCFSPMVLGHAALMTPDAPAAGLGLLACYTFWLWLKQPTWYRTLTTGLILGVAELSKTTLILFYPLWPVLWLVYRWPERKAMSLRRWRDEGLMLVVRMLIGLYVINLGYLGLGSFIPLKEYFFRSELFGAAGERAAGGNRFKESWLGSVPVPLPYDYVLGIDHQQKDFEQFWGPSYLRGKFQEKGWWYYYLYAVLVKTPVGTLALAVLSAGSVGWRLASRATAHRKQSGVLTLSQGSNEIGMKRSTWRDEFIVLVPALFIFAVVSSKTGFSHHLRYIFPCIPLMFVWLSRLFREADRFADPDDGKSSTDGASQPNRTWSKLNAIAAFCLIATISSSLWHYPHSLAYFNDLVGGPKHGPDHLLNSNIDWGQDLLHLENWIQRHADSRAVYLAFDNNCNPFSLEIPNIQPWPFRRVEDFQQGQARSPNHLGSPKNPANSNQPHQPADLRTDGRGLHEQQRIEHSAGVSVPEGYYAINVNQLYEFPRWITDRNGEKYNIDTRPLASLRVQPPVGWAGYSIRIYSADQLRTAYLEK